MTRLTYSFVNIYHFVCGLNQAFRINVSSLRGQAGRFSGYQSHGFVRVHVAHGDLSPERCQCGGKLSASSFTLLLPPVTPY